MAWRKAPTKSQLCLASVNEALAHGTKNDQKEENEECAERNDQHLG